METNALKLLSMVNEYYTKLVDRGCLIDTHWPIIHSWICSKLYNDFVNPKYNSFWTLEDPEEIQRVVITVYDKHSSYTSSIRQLADSFIAAWSAMELHNKTGKITHYFGREFISRTECIVNNIFFIPDNHSSQGYS